MVFQAGYPALSLSYPANRRKNVYSLHRSIPSVTVEDWKQVIFTDESKFVMSYGNKGPRVWRQKYERHKAACLKRSSSIRPPLWSGDACHPEELEVCGFLPPKTTVNTEVYIDLLDAYLLPSINSLLMMTLCSSMTLHQPIAPIRQQNT